MGNENNVEKLTREVGLTLLPQRYQLQEQTYRGQPQDPLLTAYSVMLNGSEMLSYHKSLLFRQHHKSIFIQIYHGKISKPSKDYYKLILYIEKIIMKLQSVCSLPYAIMIKVLYFSMIGFKKAFQNFGYFKINEGMIGFNYNNQIKIWPNKKYSRYLPVTAYSCSNILQPANAMLQDLVQIFYCKVDKCSLPLNFKLEAKSFDQLIHQIEEKVGLEFLTNKIQNFQSKQQNWIDPKSKIPEQENEQRLNNFNRNIQKLNNKTINFSYQGRKIVQSNKIILRPNSMIKFTNIENKRAVSGSNRQARSLNDNNKKITFNYTKQGKGGNNGSLIQSQKQENKQMPEVECKESNLISRIKTGGSALISRIKFSYAK